MSPVHPVAAQQRLLHYNVKILSLALNSNRLPSNLEVLVQHASHLPSEQLAVASSAIDAFWASPTLYAIAAVFQRSHSFGEVN